MQRITEDPLAKCRECGSSEFKRLISATAFVLKGSGWYKTDYSSSKSTASASTQDAAKTTENKSEDSAKAENTPAKKESNTETKPVVTTPTKTE